MVVPTLLGKWWALNAMMQLCVVLVLWIDWGTQREVLLLMSSFSLTPFQGHGESVYISPRCILGSSFSIFLNNFGETRILMPSLFPLQASTSLVLFVLALFCDSPSPIFDLREFSYPVKTFLTSTFGGSKVTCLSILFNRNPQLQGEIWWFHYSYLGVRVGNEKKPLGIPENRLNTFWSRVDTTSYTILMIWGSGCAPGRSFISLHSLYFLLFTFSSPSYAFFSICWMTLYFSYYRAFTYSLPFALSDLPFFSLLISWLICILQISSSNHVLPSIILVLWEGHKLNKQIKKRAKINSDEDQNITFVKLDKLMLENMAYFCGWVRFLILNPELTKLTGSTGPTTQDPQW